MHPPHKPTQHKTHQAREQLVLPQHQVQEQPTRAAVCPLDRLPQRGLARRVAELGESSGRGRRRLGGGGEGGAGGGGGGGGGDRVAALPDHVQILAGRQHLGGVVVEEGEDVLRAEGGAVLGGWGGKVG